jgi:hypothetical protein
VANSHPVHKLDDVCAVSGKCRSFMPVLLILFALAAVAPAQDGDQQDAPFDRESIMFRDSLELRSGQVLTGELLDEETVNKRKTVVFKTVDGDLLRLDVARLVKSVDPLTDDQRRYNQHLQDLPDTAEAHHEMVNWCQQQEAWQGRYKLQIEFHRKRIMELDPNDERVRRKLEYKFIQSEGRWVHEEQYWRSKGYVPDGAAWVPQLQVEISARNDASRESGGSAKSEFAKWQRLIKRDAGAALPELLKIMDEEMVAVVFAELGDLQTRFDRQAVALRSIYAEAFGNFPSATSASGLVQIWMIDANERVLDLLNQEQFKDYRKSAVNSLSLFLRSKDNATVLRAADAMGELESSYRLLSLIEALATTHVYESGDANRTNASLQRGGANAGSFDFGSNKKVGKVTVANRNVLEALKKLTDQDFGFRKDAWTQWYLRTHTKLDLPARPDYE